MATWVRATACFGYLFVALACGGKDKDPGPSDGGGSGGTSGQDGGDDKWRAAVGDNGVFVQTFDDLTWQSRTLASVDLRSVACIGNNLAWAVGDEGTILHSSDSGRSFVQQVSRVTRRLNAVRATFAVNGEPAAIVAGEGGFISVTRDAGATWRSAQVSTKSDLRGIAVGHGFELVVAVGDAGTVLRSVDQAQTFEQQQLPGAPNLTAVAMTGDAGHVVVVDAEGTVWESTDAGANFEVAFKGDRGLTSVALDSDGGWGIAVGEQGTLLERASGGAWSRTGFSAASALHAAMISHDGTRAYLAGDGGGLWIQKSGEEEWARADSGTTATLRSLEDLDPH